MSLGGFMSFSSPFPSCPQMGFSGWIPADQVILGKEMSVLPKEVRMMIYRFMPFRYEHLKRIHRKANEVIRIVEIQRSNQELINGTQIPHLMLNPTVFVINDDGSNDEYWLDTSRRINQSDLDEILSNVIDDHAVDWDHQLRHVMLSDLHNVMSQVSKACLSDGITVSIFHKVHQVVNSLRGYSRPDGSYQHVFQCRIRVAYEQVLVEIHELLRLDLTAEICIMKDGKCEKCEGCRGSKRARLWFQAGNQSLSVMPSDPDWLEKCANWKPDKE